MKAGKILLVAILVLAAMFSVAGAATTVYITGSSAFRNVTNAQISALLTGATVASSHPTLASANAVSWTGGTLGGTALDVKAAWTGSAAGIQGVAANGGGSPAVKVRFLAVGATGTANADPNAPGNSAIPADLQVPDICMSDNTQSSTPYASGRSIIGGGTYLGLTDSTVGVVAFTWAASNGFPAGVSMTKKLAEAQYLGGVASLGQYTGVLADSPSLAQAPTKLVYAVGRNPQSGSRITALAESGVGVANFVKQWKPVTTGKNGNITGLTLTPIESLNGVTTGQDGNSGENSGGNLRDYLTCTLATGTYSLGTGQGGLGAGLNNYDINGAYTTTTYTDPNVLPNGEPGPSFLISYMSVTDFNTIKTGSTGTTKPAVEVLWNSVAFSQDGIKTGTYTFWGYEHIMWRTTLGNGTTGGPTVKLTFGNNLKTALLGQTSAQLSPNVALGDMRVTRSGDGGGIVNPNF